MARLIQAVAKYGPKVERNKVAKIDDVAEFVARGTGLSDSQVGMVLRELHKAVLTFNRKGTPVQLPGLGTFGVSVTLDGRRKMTFRPDSDLRYGMNEPKVRAKLPIANANNIGLDNAGLKALWDAEHPDDPAYFMGRAEFYDPDAPAETAQEAEEAAP